MHFFETEVPDPLPPGTEVSTSAMKYPTNPEPRFQPRQNVHNTKKILQIAIFLPSFQKLYYYSKINKFKG
jgi:hypothetical protein